MDNKIGYLFSTIKQKIPGLAAGATVASRFFSKAEVEVLLGKIHSMGEKTSSEVEKIVQKSVKKILQDELVEVATPEVHEEIVAILMEHNNGKNILPFVKYVNSVVVSNAPRNLQSFLNFKKNIAHTLIKDAQKRIKDRGTVDVEVF